MVRERAYKWLLLLMILFILSENGEGIWFQLPATGSKCLSEKIYGDVIVFAGYFSISATRADPAPTMAVEVTPFPLISRPLRVQLSCFHQCIDFDWIQSNGFRISMREREILPRLYIFDRILYREGMIQRFRIINRSIQVIQTQQKQRYCDLAVLSFEFFHRSSFTSHETLVIPLFLFFVTLVGI